MRLVPSREARHDDGIDVSSAPIEAGSEREIVPARLADRLPRADLHVTRAFRGAPLGTTFRSVIGQSVFSRIAIARFDRCLTALAPSVEPGGRLFATVFPASGDAFDGPVVHPPAGATTRPGRDPYDTSGQIDALAAGQPDWTMGVVGRGIIPAASTSSC